MNKLVKISAAIISSVAFVGMAQAATPGAYAGAGLGYSKLSTPKNANIGDVAGTLSNSTSSGGMGGRLFGGYNFNKYFGLEAAYATYANSKAKGSLSTPDTNVGGTYSASASQKVSEDALSLVAKAYLPIQDSGFNVYALGGVAEVFSQNKASFSSQNGDGTPDQASYSHTYKNNALRPTYGLGASYDINSNLTTNLEYSRIQGRGNISTSNNAIPNADLVSLNLAYNFG